MISSASRTRRSFSDEPSVDCFSRREWASVSSSTLDRKKASSVVEDSCWRVRSEMCVLESASFCGE